VESPTSRSLHHSFPVILTTQSIWPSRSPSPPEVVLLSGLPFWHNNGLLEGQEYNDQAQQNLEETSVIPKAAFE